jgi:hypothetical protein
MGIGLTAMFALGTLVGIPDAPVFSRIVYAALTLIVWVLGFETSSETRGSPHYLPAECGQAPGTF